MKKKSFSLKLTTLAVLSLCFTFLSTGALILQNFEKMLSSWGEDLQMTVDLSSTATDEDQKNLRSKILNYSGVEDVQYVSQQKALENFQVQMAGYAPDLLKDPELVQLIPASLQVKFKKNLQGPEQITLMKKIHQDIKTEKSVSEVSYGQEWLQKYTQLTGFFRGLVFVLAFSLGSAALFVIAHVIQTSVFQRKFEIEVLELLGASPSMIRRPFLVEGIKIGFMAMTISLLTSWCLYMFTLEKFAGPLALFRLTEFVSFLDFKTIVVFIFAGPALGGIASYLCLHRINTGWAASGRLI